MRWDFILLFVHNNSTSLLNFDGNKFFIYKYASSFKLFAYILSGLLYFSCPFGLSAEVDYDRIEFLQHKKAMERFYESMSPEMREYYIPRKRYIDRQSIYPFAGEFYRVYIIKRGTYWRKKYLSRNKKEILKLEEFLGKANDFELNRYFTGDEESFLRTKSSDSIREIKKEASRDEFWRYKSDPVFATYIHNKATSKEKLFYKNNLSLFYVEFSGKQRISYLQSLSKNERGLPFEKTGL